MGAADGAGLNRLSAVARAKINLFLHVGPVEADGYHPLASLVAFADIGDIVTVEASDRLSLEVMGPFSGALSGGEGEAGDNLILRALRRLGEVTGQGDPPIKVTLDKRLPIAAGLGGGSSDAGMALRLAREALGLDMDDTALETVSRIVGADGPMCLRVRTAWAEGRGDVLTDVPSFPILHAVLVNPGIPSPTGAVYRAFDAFDMGRADRPVDPVEWSAAAVIEWLACQRNDLQPPALSLAPEIGLALEAVASLPETRLTRMSGSGATVFGLFESREHAVDAAQALMRDGPAGWWVRPVTLGGVAA